MIRSVLERRSRRGGREFWRAVAPVAWVLTLVLLPPAAADGSSSGEIDAAVWQVVSETVAAGDIEGMAATYHPAAVLVSGKGTVAIADQLTTWGEGMEKSRREGRTASVAFRFESRQDDEATAFERGLFKYVETDADGKEEPVVVPFEALLVKHKGRWLILMERQFEATDEAAWDALAQ